RAGDAHADAPAERKQTPDRDGEQKAQGSWSHLLCEPGQRESQPERLRVSSRNPAGRAELLVEQRRELKERERAEDTHARSEHGVSLGERPVMVGFFAHRDGGTAPGRAAFGQTTSLTNERPSQTPECKSSVCCSTNTSSPSRATCSR